MVQHVRIRSWHLDSGIMSRGGMILTMCGRWAPKLALTSPFLKPNERSCESCYRNQEIRDRG